MLIFLLCLLSNIHCIILQYPLKHIYFKLLKRKDCLPFSPVITLNKRQFSIYSAQKKVNSSVTDAVGVIVKCKIEGRCVGNVCKWLCMLHENHSMNSLYPMPKGSFLFWVSYKHGMWSKNGADWSVSQKTKNL